MEELDVGHLALFVGTALHSVVEKELGRRHRDVRPSWGSLIEHLVGTTRSIGELAERMEVTQQAASKAVSELVKLGYVERVADEADARVTRVRLSKRGDALVADSRRVRERCNARLVKRVGRKRIDKTREVLGELLDELGGLERVRTRRIVPR